jgi:hypothetical protein
MCGVWIALEHVNEVNGTLQIVPGSHKWEIYDYESLNLTHPDNIKNGEAENYSYYENFLIDLIKSKNGETKPVSLKKGQALIWAANMLHGGCNVEGITDLEKTRLTQANHYFFYGCDEYYCPMFSEKSKGKYAKKWCDDDNNIKTHLDKINEDSSNVYCLSGIYYPEGDWKYINNEGFVDIPEGYMSVAFKSDILKDKSCIYEYNEKLKHDKDCFQSDDFIVANYFSMNNIKKYQIFNKDLNRVIWWNNYRNVLSYGVDGDGLHQINEGGHEETYKRIYNKLKEINFLFL